ncbi:chromatin regulatory protein sir2 [Arthroderma uncinatum]|uniref:chromatin regulatory protein sir2 n=1 Tax=Arthroderma uncinatum TaxID=74035 RepID=UPI00144A5ADA|nr:chromatin regulatory protein sir2 [Arthroderma uncinatum]KAF3481464.1 chromatin regulatory protein sir2 [Arthroderma uncinatum]
MDVVATPAGEERVPNASIADAIDVAGEVIVGASEAEPAAELIEDASHLPEDSDEEESGDEWETTSLYEDALQFVGDEQLRDGVPGACTLQEAVTYRRRIHAIGQAAFLAETLGRGTISAKKLCTAFGIMPPPFLEGAPDKAYHPLLFMGMSRESSKRLKLPEYNTIDDVVQLMKKAKNIIVITGAGISTSLGIPDFRSKDIGLYSKLEHLGLSDPQEVFDIEVFREDPSIFYSIAKDILPTEKRFSPTHAFIRLLQDKGKLLTNFTQNIDNIEGAAGILPEKMIQCHGSFATASCMDCKHQVPGDQLFDTIRRGEIPKCVPCEEKSQARPRGLKRKRSSNGKMRRSRSRSGYDDDSDGGGYSTPTTGVMKPDITFFGEDLPDIFKKRLLEHDRERADLVIVIGTSLKVAPVAEVPGVLPSKVPQVYISRTPVSHIEFDVDMLGDCDVVVSELCRRAGWDLQHEMIPSGQQIHVEQAEGFESRYTFTATGV